MIRLAFVAAAAVAALCTPARAQGGMGQLEEMKKRMEEISRLMRDSEKLLLEITRIDRLVAEQEEIVRKLEELEPPRADADAAAREAREKQRQELQEQQADIARRLEALFENQRQSADRSVAELEKLLRQWPRGQGSGHDPNSKQRRRPQQDRDKRLRDKQQEKKQSVANKPRDPKDLFKDKQQRDTRRPPDQTGNAALRRIEAWIARLPPEEQERLNRGDFSRIPAPYRRLVREYTILRAKREAEEATER